MICNKCGKEFDGNFCPNCGSKLKTKEPRKKLTKKQIMSIVIPIVIVAVLISIIVPSVVVSNNIFRVGKVDKIKIGDSKEQVIKILGEPYEKTDYNFQYYGKDYLKLAKQIDDYYNSDLDIDDDFDLDKDIDDFDPDKDLNWDDEDKITKMEEELEKMIYKYIEVEFDTDGKVESVFFDAEKCDSKEYKKVVDSYKITPNKVTRYVSADITYSVKFTDKSFYKSTAKKGFIAYDSSYSYITWSDKWKSDYKVEVKVKENKDIIYMENKNDILYLLDGNGILNVEGDTDNGVFENLSMTSSFSGYANKIKGLHIGQGINGSVSNDVFLRNVEQITVDRNNERYYAEGNCLIDKNSNSIILGCKNSIIPSVVTGIDSSAFDSCISFENVKVDESNSNYSVENNLIIDKSTNTLLLACRSITNISIPSSVTSIGYEAFDGCRELTSIEIPSSVTSIGNSAFYLCKSLTSIEIPNSVTSIGSNAFSYCKSLTSIEIPRSVTSIGNYAFRDCSSLTSIVIPSGVTSIGDSAFRDCSSLTNIEIPSSVTSIGDFAFYKCSSLTSIVIPSSVTSIGKEAFYKCSSLTSIVIPTSVTSIGSKAFYGCSSLTIYCEAESRPRGWDSWWNRLNDTENTTVPVVWGYKK